MRSLQFEYYLDLYAHVMAKFISQNRLIVLHTFMFFCEWTRIISDIKYK